MNKLCYVTSFLDIGRDEWTKFDRTVEKYMETFQQNLLRHFENMDSQFEPYYELIIYLDKKHVDKISFTRKNIRIIPIDEDHLNKISPLWQRLPREIEIVNSPEYRTRFAVRLQYPENSKPRYSLINHAKIDFLIDAGTKTDSQYFCWVDFGYLEIPKNPLDIDLLQKDKINYNLINPLDIKDRDVFYTMLVAPERIGGGFFFGRRDILPKYQKLYHSVHSLFQNNDLVDDDQHLALRCYFANPDLFYLHNIGGWFRMLETFQCKEVPKTTTVVEETPQKFLRSNSFFDQVVICEDRNGRIEYFKGLCKGKSVLHMGCADWPVFNPYNNLHIQLTKSNPRIEGYDLDVETIEKMKTLPDLQNSIFHTELPAKKYDFLLIPETIEHVDNPCQFLQSIIPLTTNDTELLITAPNAFCKTWIDEVKFTGKEFRELVHPDHKCWFSPYTLTNTVLNAYKKLKRVEILEIGVLDNQTMAYIHFKLI